MINANATLRLLFDGREVKRWQIDRELFKRKCLLNQSWLIDFAASVHVNMIRDWLCEVLRLKEVPRVASGVEVWIASGAGTEIGVSLSQVGQVLLWPIDPTLLRRASSDLASSIASGDLKLHLRIREESSQTWGGALHSELKLNATWRRERFDMVLQHFTKDRLMQVVTKQREKSDPDACAMYVALFTDVLQFLAMYPGPYQKQDFIAWKRFVTEIVGRDINLLLAFCPRKRVFFDTTVLSDSLDLLSPRCFGPVETLKEVLQLCIKGLGRRRLTPSLLFAHVNVKNPACTSNSVIKKRINPKANINGFFLGSASQTEVEQYASEQDYDIEVKKSGRMIISGKCASVVHTIKLDQAIHIHFIDQWIIDSFPKNLHIDQRIFSCQADGDVLTHAIALLIRTSQQKEWEKVKQLKTEIQSFSNESEVGFPVIDGNKRQRKKKHIYFSDYNKKFYYRSDQSSSFPCECVPLAYSKEMHENAVLISL
jgi:hypothetical protein